MTKSDELERRYRDGYSDGWKDGHAQGVMMHGPRAGSSTDHRPGMEQNEEGPGKKKKKSKNSESKTWWQEHEHAKKVYVEEFKARRRAAKIKQDEDLPEAMFDDVEMEGDTVHDDALFEVQEDGKEIHWTLCAAEHQDLLRHALVQAASEGRKVEIELGNDEWTYIAKIFPSKEKIDVELMVEDHHICGYQMRKSTRKVRAIRARPWTCIEEEEGNGEK